MQPLIRFTFFFLFGLSLLRAEGNLELRESNPQAWKLVELRLQENTQTTEGLLHWRLTSEGEEVNYLLEKTETQNLHENRFRPRKTGEFVVQVFENKKLVAEKNIKISASCVPLETLATCLQYQELGFIEWIDNFEEAKKVAFSQKKPLLIAYFTGCGVSARMSEELFLNPEFLKLSRDFVCVPLPLGQHPSGEYFEVLNGLSFVLLDSYGMFLGSVMRPSFETLQNFMKTRLKKAKNLENQRNALFQKTETGEDSSRREALYQLGQFLQQGKAFDQATLSYLKILELLEKDSAPEWKETVLHQMVKMYMDFQASTEMIQLFERYAPSSDYMWLGLGMAHFYKAKKKEAGKEAALEAFQKILNDFPQSSYAPYTQKMIDILKTL